MIRTAGLFYLLLLILMSAASGSAFEYDENNEDAISINEPVTISVVGGTAPYYWAADKCGIEFIANTTTAPVNTLSMTGTEFCGSARLVITDSSGEQVTGVMRSPYGQWEVVDSYYCHPALGECYHSFGSLAGYRCYSETIAGDTKTRYHNVDALCSGSWGSGTDCDYLGGCIPTETPEDTTLFTYSKDTFKWVCYGEDPDFEDTDGDGIPDCNDACPDNPDKIAPGLCGCSLSDADSDGDGTPDCNDECPDDPDKTTPQECGCNTPETDTDGDGVPDCIDNCPEIENPDQSDINGNGTGDACEPCEINLSATATELKPGQSIYISASVTGIDPADIMWSITSDPGTDARASITQDGSGAWISGATGSGTLIIKAENPDDPSCSDEEEIEVGCGICSGDACTPGNGDGPDLGSIDMKWSLGKSAKDKSAGRLILEADAMTQELSTPSALRVSTLSSVTDVIYENGQLRQIVAAETVVDIVTETEFLYHIRFYKPEAMNGSVDGVVQLISGEEPMVTWSIENPDATQTPATRLKLTESRDGQITEHLYTVNETGTAWSLEKGGGLVTEDLTISMDREGSTIKTRTIKDNTGAISSITAETYRSYPWGEQLVKRVTDPDGAGLTTTRDWYEDPSDSGSYGKPASIINPDGSWERYTYTDDGYLSTTTVPLLDAPFDAPDTEVKTIENDYTLHTGDSDPARFRAYPRTVTTWQAGIVTSKTYHVFQEDRSGCVTDTREDCAAPDALPGDDTNLITRTTYYPVDETQASSGNIKSTCFKDGKTGLYTYDYGSYTQTNGSDQPGTFTQDRGSEIRTTVIHATASSPDGIPGKTTMEILIEDEFGRLLLEELHVRTETGYERISWKVHTRDDLGRLTATTYSDGTREEKTWSCCVLESASDRSGKLTFFTYDALKRVLTETKETGQEDLVTSFTYDGSGNELTQTVTAGTLALSSSGTYDLAGRIKTATDTHGLTTTHSYQAGGRTITATLPGGATQITDHYLDGRIKSVTGTGITARYYDYGVNADGAHWTRVFSGSSDSPMWETTTVNLLDQVLTIEKPGFNGTETITNYYNKSGQLAKTTAPGMTDTLVEYNELGEQTTTGLDINQNGILDDTSMDRITRTETTYTYSDSAWWQTTTREMLPYDNQDQTLTLSETGTRLTGLGTDGLTSEVRQTDRFGNLTTTRTYVDRGTKTTRTVTEDPDSSINAETVTINGLVTSSTGKTGRTVTYGYDPLERRISVTDPRTGTTTTGYNDSNQVAYVEDPALNRTSFTYHPDTGRKLSETDPLDRTVYYRYDDRGAVTHTWGATYPVHYIYDGQGRMIEMYTYRSGDGWEGPEWPELSDDDPDVTTWHFHQASGLLESKEDALGKSTTYTYHDGGALATRTWARTLNGNPLTTTYTYDPGTGDLTGIDYSDDTPDIACTWNRAGKRASVSDAAGTRTFTYNDYLQPETETLPDGTTLTRHYETTGMIGRNTGFTLDNTYAVSYGYEDGGRLTTVSWDAAGATGSVSYAYEPDTDRIRSLAYDSGAAVTYAYEPNRDLKTSVTNTYNDTLVSQYDYLYDKAGRRTSMTTSGNVFDASEPTLPENPDTGLDITQSSTTDYTSNSLNQYTQIEKDGAIRPLAYDHDGNLVDDGFRSYIWNAENRLISVEPISPVDGDKKLTFTYDYMGRRVQKTVYDYDAGTWTLETEISFIYDGWNLILENRSEPESDPIDIYYVHGQDLSRSFQGAGGVGGLLARIDGSDGKQYCYFYDANGNIGQMIDASDGSVQASYEYSAFGNVIKKSGDLADDNTFRFSTKYHDDEAALVYYGYRYYDPVLGRWPSRDPINEVGSMVLRNDSKNQNPVLNPYGFVLNNPQNWTDSLGLKVFFCYGRYRTYDHATVCLNKKCAGLMPPAKFLEAFHGTGTIDEEKFVSEYCIPKDVDENKCCDQKKYEDCIQREAIDKIGSSHYFGWTTFNCLSWAKKIIINCHIEACQQ